MSLFHPYKYREILPRGTGIVTRRPLILQLINAKEGKEKLKNISETHSAHCAYSPYDTVQNTVCECYCPFECI